MQPKKVFNRSVGVSFSPEMYARMEAFCSERGCSRSWLINKATSLYLDEFLADRKDYDIAVTAWKEFEDSGFKSSSAEEVFAKAGL